MAGDAQGSAGDEWSPVMSLKFNTAEARDAFAKRLDQHAYDMIRSRDQGFDGKVWATDELINDLRAAAAIVACSEVQPS